VSRAVPSLPRDAREPGRSSLPRFGALLISLDFELHWGVRDVMAPDGPYRANLLGARRAIPRMLELFTEFDVGVTWATVGFLFARSRAELSRFSPALRPAYRDANLSPYDEPLGEGEDDDPLHYGASLVEQIRRYPRQEVATHTFSHYYCLEPGQTREAFAADLASAVNIAAARGITLRSVVFPRNQYNPEYADVLRQAGIVCYRGNQRGGVYRAVKVAGEKPWIRAARLTDAYLDLSGHGTTPWEAVLQPDGLCNLPASRLLRPWSDRLRALEPLRLARITRALRHAAEAGEIFHLWWHPHNFGVRQEENLAVLRQVLEAFATLRESHGMRSLSMHEAARLVAGPAAEPAPPPPVHDRPVEHAR
jgi:peptidoglycan/xylan/chitin deacetylase (PgdA/CDA1 family)